MRIAMSVLRASILITIAALALRSADAQSSHADAATTSGGADAAKQCPPALGNRGKEVREKGVAAHVGRVESSSGGILH